MKVTVLVPSPQYRDYAGGRIRYGRVAQPLAESGIDMTIEDIAQFSATETGCDVLLISKCHDPRSLTAAAVVAQRGIRVGVDLFDDYFSQTSDSGLIRYRNWLTQMLGICDFALCSTAAMAEVVQRYRPGLTRHVMNDPAPEFERAKLPSVLARKAAAARDEGRVRVAWFGVGDNPRFSVGLDDLRAFSGELAALTACGLGVELNVLTNTRSLTAEGLALVKHLPVRTEIQEWTEQRERSLLNESFAAFLPVSAQSFSIAKSLNRAVTALSAGCQILSAGYPLYRPFDRLIYRDAAALGGDLLKGELRFSSASVDEYCSIVAELASAEEEGSRLATFLSSLPAPAPSPGPLVLVHGHTTNGLAHKLAHAVGGLSVASPFATAPLGYDVIFRGAAPRLTMWVSQKTAQRLAPRPGVKFGGTETINDHKFVEVREPGDKPVDAPAVNPMPTLALQLAEYTTAMDEIGRRLDRAFEPSRVLFAETSSLPFDVGQP
jgi:hypothetical protein